MNPELQPSESRRFGSSLACAALAAVMLIGCAPAGRAAIQAQAGDKPAAPAQEPGKKADAAVAGSSQAPTPPATPMNAKQKEIADDTAKLLLLADQLKVEMDKSSKDTLSLAVVRKAEEIEKLARKVQTEVRASLSK